MRLEEDTVATQPDARRNNPGLRDLGHGKGAEGIIESILKRRGLAMPRSCARRIVDGGAASHRSKAMTARRRKRDRRILRSAPANFASGSGASHVGETLRATSRCERPAPRPVN